MAAASRPGPAPGDNLAGVGMNVNLAPVLDVFWLGRQLHRQVPALVQCEQREHRRPRSDQAFISAQQAAKVAATAKHFPGLGGGHREPEHGRGPVTMNVSLATAAQGRRGALHQCDSERHQTGHGVVGDLSRPRPVPSRRAVVEGGAGELRGRLGYRGVTITDALDAGGLRGYGSSGHRAVLAAGAGMDLLLSSTRTVTGADNAATGLSTAYQQGTLGKAAFMAAVERLIALRETLH